MSLRAAALSARCWSRRAHLSTIWNVLGLLSPWCSQTALLMTKDLRLVMASSDALQGSCSGRHPST
jgi:hypothetical protein